MLEGERVVDAVARHRDRVAQALQREHHGLLLFGRHAPEHAVLGHDGVELGVVCPIEGGQLPRIKPRAVVVDARLPRDRGHRARVITRDDAQLNLLLAEVAERLMRVVAHLLPERHESDGAQARGQLGLGSPLTVGSLDGRVEHHFGVSEYDRALARGGALGEPGESIRRPGHIGEHDVGGSHDPGAARRAVGERDGAPLAAARELDVTNRRLGWGRGEAFGERAGGGIGVAVGAHPREHGRSGGVEVGGGEGVNRVARCRVGKRLDRVEHHAALGERAGLVEAQHVDAREALNSGELLHEHLATRELDGPDGEGDARHEDEALGDHRDEARGRGHRGLTPGARRNRDLPAPDGLHLTVDDNGADWQQQNGDPRDNAGDAAAQLAAHERELLGLGRDARGVRVGADTDDPRKPAARDDTRARHELAPRRRRHRIGLTGEQGLVDVEPVRFEHDGVGRHLIARGKYEHVVEHDLPHGDFADDAVAQHAGLRCVEHRKPTQRELGPKLLRHPDHDVGDDEEAKESVLPVAEYEQQREAAAHDEVEEREQIGLHDAPERATGVARHDVGLPELGARAHFVERQACGGACAGGGHEREPSSEGSAPTAVSRRRGTPPSRRPGLRSVRAACRGVRAAARRGRA